MALKLTKKNSKVKKVVKKVIPVTANKSSRPQVGASAPKQQFKIPQVRYIEAVGRRKVATARVRIYEGEGDFVVNGKAAGEYFGGIRNAQARYLKPFEVTGTKGKFAVTAHTNGSGVSSQLDAVMHGLSRALKAHSIDFQPLLKAAGLLTRDDRMKETRKIGTGGKARRKRQSPKR